MRKFLSVLALWFCSTIVMAVPADRRPHLVRLADGTTVTAYLHGDEHYSWMQTADGKVLRHLADDVYEFTRRSVEEEIQIAQAYWNEANQMRRAPLRLGEQSTAPLPAIGSPKVPVILVQFQDSVFTVGQNEEEIRDYYDKFCNGSRDGKRYQTDYYWGSIYDYFYDQSEGQFRPEFTIIGPVTLSQPQSYYGEWVSNNNKDRRYDEFVRESLEKAVAEYEVEWSEFDNRGKGTVDMAFFIFAGCGENSSGVGSHIWPKEKVSSQTITLSSGSKVTFSTSGCCCEKNAATDSKTGEILYTVPDGIGVMCHELSHALGLPDFYDTNYKAFGMDIWSLMDWGCYAMTNGKRPVNYTAYEREFMGWSTIETLSEPGWVAVNPFNLGGKAYRIISDANPDECYILESRQDVQSVNNCWDGLVARRICHGLQVTHVDYLSSAWNSNRVNTNANHQRMTIIAANNKYIGTSASGNSTEWMDTWTGQLFPYTYSGTDDEGATVQLCLDSLTTLSTPAAVTFSGDQLMHKDIHAIRQHDDLSMTFYFGSADISRGALLPAAPVIVTAENAGAFDLSTTVSMSAENGVDIFYTLDGTDPTSESQRYSEPITLDETTTIKAIGYVGTALSSDASSATVFLADAIGQVKQDLGSVERKSALYDVSGRPVGQSQNLRPGIYIRNNRKKYVKN